jgi:mRNA-degrading endonuclease toxin of MazEF toxin-antitoxin module
LDQAVLKTTQSRDCIRTKFVVSREYLSLPNPYNESRSPLTGIVPLTTAVAKNPVHVNLPKEETDLESDSTALVDHARFLDRTRLGAVAAGRLIPSAQSRLDRNLARVLGL